MSYRNKKKKHVVYSVLLGKKKASKGREGGSSSFLTSYQGLESNQLRVHCYTGPIVI